MTTKPQTEEEIARKYARNTWKGGSRKMDTLPNYSFEDFLAGRRSRDEEVNRLKEKLGNARAETLFGVMNMIMKERENIAPSVYSHLYSLLEQYLKAAAPDALKELSDD